MRAKRRRGLPMWIQQHASSQGHKVCAAITRDRVGVLRVEDHTDGQRRYVDVWPDPTCERDLVSFPDRNDLWRTVRRWILRGSLARAKRGRMQSCCRDPSHQRSSRSLKCAANPRAAVDTAVPAHLRDRAAIGELAKVEETEQPAGHERRS